MKLDSFKLDAENEVNSNGSKTKGVLKKKTKINETKFCLHDFVFAKFENYPHWPSRIVQIDKNKTDDGDCFQVYFYGTYKTAYVSKRQLFSYKDKKYEYGKTRRVKNFNAAIAEIEVEIKKFKNSVASFDTLGSFSRYSFVFSKFPGYPYWPSRIYSVDETKPQHADKYCVFFYGTHNYGYLSEKEMLPYSQHKTELTNKVNSKEFKEGLEEIEQHISKTKKLFQLFNTNKKISGVLSTSNTQKKSLKRKILNDSICLNSTNKQKKIKVEECCSKTNLAGFAQQKKQSLVIKTDAVKPIKREKSRKKFAKKNLENILVNTTNIGFKTKDHLEKTKVKNDVILKTEQNKENVSIFKNENKTTEQTALLKSKYNRSGCVQSKNKIKENPFYVKQTFEKSLEDLYPMKPHQNLYNSCIDCYGEPYSDHLDDIGNKFPNRSPFFNAKIKSPFPQLPSEEDRYDKNGLPTDVYQQKLVEITQYYIEWLLTEVEYRNAANIVRLIDEMYKTDFRYTRFGDIEKVIATLQSVCEKIGDIEAKEKCSTMKHYLDVYVE